MNAMQSIEERTSKEIRRQITALEKKRDLVTTELVEISSARLLTGRPPEQLTDFQRAVRARTREMLGETEQHDVYEREISLEVERAAIDQIKRVLLRDETAAIAIESARWAEANRPKWRALCKEIIATAAKLEGLADRARNMIHEVEAGTVRMGLGQYIGGHVEISFGNDCPLREVIAAAVEEGFITRGDVKGAQAV